MYLIALAGGQAAERSAISAQLVASGKDLLQAFTQATPTTDFALRRVEILRAALEHPGRARNQAGTVITHCLTEEEAQEVRLRGGVVWHVYGRPSSHVVIRRGDAIVGIGCGQPEHVLEPLEALSELTLLRLASVAGQHAREILAKLARHE